MYVFPYTGLLAGQPGTAEMASGAQQSSVPAAGSQEDSHQPSSTTANIRQGSTQLSQQLAHRKTASSRPRPQPISGSLLRSCPSSWLTGKQPPAVFGHSQYQVGLYAAVGLTQRIYSYNLILYYILWVNPTVNRKHYMQSVGHPRKLVLF